MRSTHNDWDVPSNIPRCTGLCRTSVSAFFFCTALGTKQDENMQQLKKEKKKTVLPQTGWGKKKKEVKFFNRDLLFHFMSTEAAAQ